MNKIVTSFALAAFALLSAEIASAKENSPLSLMEESDSRHRLAHESTEWKMVLQGQGQSPQSRRLEILRFQDPKDAAGDRQRIRFLAPGDIKDTRLLTIESKAGDDKQWLYLPAFNRTRRLGASDLGDRFAGTDFFYEDLRRRRIREYRYELKGEESVDGAECYVIESRPGSEKVAKESPYGRSTIWMRKDNLYIVRMRHFDKQGRPFKELSWQDLRKISGKAWRADKIVAVDLRRKHRTLVLVASRDTGSKVASDLLAPSSFAQR